MCMGDTFRDHGLTRCQKRSIEGFDQKAPSELLSTMASKEIAAMLDTLMGKNRNTEVSSTISSAQDSLIFFQLCKHKGFPPSSPLLLLARTLYRGVVGLASQEWSGQCGGVNSHQGVSRKHIFYDFFWLNPLCKYLGVAVKESKFVHQNHVFCETP